MNARTHRLSGLALLLAGPLSLVACRNDSVTISSAPVTAAATTMAPATVAPTVASTTGDAADLGHVVIQPGVAAVTPVVDGALTTPDGRSRTYHVYVPSSYVAGTAVPLLLALHGGGGWGTQFESNSGFDGLAQANGFIVVYPDGVGTGTDGSALRTWNGGACCGVAAREQIDDVGFVRLLIAQLESQYTIDPARVFAAGHSNGGILALRLACELSDQIAAVGVQSSALEVPSCTPSQPVSVLQIHGAADENVPIGGGKGTKGPSEATFTAPILAATTLAAGDGCPAAPVRSVDPRNTDLSVSAWSPCANGTSVAFVEVAGAAHPWMGHPAQRAVNAGLPYMQLDAGAVIWNFLTQHPRR